MGTSSGLDNSKSRYETIFCNPFHSIPPLLRRNEGAGVFSWHRHGDCRSGTFPGAGSPSVGHAPPARNWCQNDVNSDVRLCHRASPLSCVSYLRKTKATSPCLAEGHNWICRENTIRMPSCYMLCVSLTAYHRYFPFAFLRVIIQSSWGTGQITQRKKALKMLKEFYESFSHREGKWV